MGDAHFEKLKRRANVKRFIDAIALAAIRDAEEGVSEYHPSNTGKALLERLSLSSLRIAPRNGDGKYARSIYTAAHYLYQTETKD